MQTTVSESAVFEGRGLHSGAPVRLVVHPAPAGHGIAFRRTDMTGPSAVIPALWSSVQISPLHTRLVNDAGASVATVEHLMAALAGLGICNARIDIDGPEVPILDGSSAPFVRGLLRAGLRRQAAPRQALRVLSPVQVQDGLAWARLDPATALIIDFTIDFPDPAIGRSHKSLHLGNGAFLRELCDSRTFCRLSDVQAMHRANLGLGGTLENAVVVDGARILTPGGLRHQDEPVRHKMLDALGDLALAGLPILGRYTGHRAGHALTNRLLRALFADPASHDLVTCDATTEARLPGAGVQSADLSLVA